MLNPTAYLPIGVPLPDVRSLPINQYDIRNVTSKRIVEIGAVFETEDVNGVTGNRLPVTIPVNIQKYLEEFSYDPAYTFRVVTVALESYSIRHEWNTVGGTGVPDGFIETTREPIAVICPQLQDALKARYFSMLPSDFGQGLYGSATVSFTDLNFPTNLDFTFGLLNPIPFNQLAYNVNVNRFDDEPKWSSQFIKSITIRLSLTATFEPNRIPVVGINNQNVIQSRVNSASHATQPHGGGSYQGNVDGRRNHQISNKSHGNSAILSLVAPDPVSSPQDVALDLTRGDGWSVGGGLPQSTEVVGLEPEFGIAQPQIVEPSNDGFVGAGRQVGGEGGFGRRGRGRPVGSFSSNNRRNTRNSMQNSYNEMENREHDMVPENVKTSQNIKTKRRN